MIVVPMRVLIYSNLFIAFAAALVTLETDCLLGLSPRPDLLVVVVLLATLMIYNLDRLGDPERPEPAVPPSARQEWIGRWRPVLWGIVIVSGVLLTLAATRLPWRTLSILAALALLAIAYSFPLLNRVPRAGNRLREIAEFKALLVAAVWTVATVLLPAVEHPRLSLAALDVGLLSLERFLFLAAITMPFDLRDHVRDAAIGLVTLSARLGVRRTRRLCIGLMIASTAIAAVHWAPQPGYAAALIASGAVTITLLAGLHEHRSEWYYALGLDGMLILQAVLVILAWRVWA